MVLLSGGGGSSDRFSLETAGTGAAFLPQNQPRPTPTTTPTSSSTQVTRSGMPMPLTALQATGRGLPRTADAATVWATGGTVAISEQQQEASLAKIRAWLGDNRKKNFVGIEDINSWVENLQMPWIGSSVTLGPNWAGGYQTPEYETWQVNQVLQQMSGFDLGQFREKAKAAGLYDPNMFPPSDAGGPTQADVYVMEQLMARANLTRLSSWEDVLAELVANPNPDLDGGSGSDYTGPTTTRSIVYQSTSVDAGRSYLRTLMRGMIGREPTDTEVQEYVAALNRQEQSRPEIIEQISEMGDNENTMINTQRVLQQAPVPEEELRRSVEQGNPEEKFTFAAQGYFDRLMEII